MFWGLQSLTEQKAFLGHCYTCALDYKLESRITINSWAIYWIQKQPNKRINNEKGRFPTQNIVSKQVF